MPNDTLPIDEIAAAVDDAERDLDALCQLRRLAQRCEIYADEDREELHTELKVKQPAPEDVSKTTTELWERLIDVMAPEGDD